MAAGGGARARAGTAWGGFYRPVGEGGGSGDAGQRQGRAAAGRGVGPSSAFPVGHSAPRGSRRQGATVGWCAGGGKPSWVGGLSGGKTSYWLGRA
jgi:hypothetical protein